jgi:glutamyl-tRNA reductase
VVIGDRSLLSQTHVDIDRIRVRFATFRAHSAQERERLARSAPGPATAEHVVLDTCHRVELVSVEDGSRADAAQLAGVAAVRRVFEVVAGFDSAVVAEEQLLGQVRGAYEAALAAGSTGPILNELFRRALRFGRAVRSHARPGTDRSLADRGAAWLEARLARVSASVVVAGTGEMGRRVATHMAARGHRITVVSASAERGGRLLGALPGDGHRLHAGAVEARTFADADALALALRTRIPVLTQELASAAPPWVLDLSAPSAVDPRVADRLGDRLMTLDGLGAIVGTRPVLAPAVERRLRAELEREVDGFVAWLDTRAGADALELLHGGAEEVRRRHLDRLRRRAALNERQLAAVEATATAMVGELLHGPSIELRRGGADADTVRRLFGLDR